MASEFSFQYPLLEIWKKGTFIIAKKSLSAKIRGIFQPNIRERGIFSMPEIKHV